MVETIAAARAELTKLCRVRGTFLALCSFALISIVVAALNGWSARSALESGTGALRDDFTPAQAGLDGVLYGQLALIVFGVLVVTGEYSSGMMRVSLFAVPRRGRLYGAKAGAAAVTATVVAIPVTLVSFLATQLALGPHGVGLGEVGVLGALVGSVAYLALMCLFASGVAAAARSAALPLAILLPTVLAGAQLLSVVGVPRELTEYLPDQAGKELLAVDSSNPLTGVVVLVAWTVAALAFGYVRHRRWDT